MTFDWGLFLGLIAIAIAAYFGLWGFRKDVSYKLGDIRDRVMVMGVTLDKAWDLLQIRFGAQTGTVERDLKNLGKTKISAKPGADMTIYFIEIEKPVLQDDLIIKFGRETGLENEEKRLFDNKLTGVSSPLPTRLVVRVPCTEPTKCTEYMSIFLKWLDSTYYNKLPEIKNTKNQSKFNLFNLHSSLSRFLQLSRYDSLFRLDFLFKAILFKRLG